MTTTTPAPTRTSRPAKNGPRQAWVLWFVFAGNPLLFALAALAVYYYR